MNDYLHVKYVIDMSEGTRSTKLNLINLYLEILIQQCKIEQEVIKNSLSIAIQSSDQVAYNLMKRPGYMAMVAGEVMHIIKCIPVEIKIKHSTECYIELQVTYNNNTYFLTPKTHILKKRGTVVDCNQVLSSQYLIDQTWYKLIHHPIEVEEPLIL